VREAAFVTHRKSIGFVCLSVHHQDIGVIMTHDFKAHVPLPPAELDSRARRGAPAVTSVLTDIVCRLPPAAPRVEQDLTSLPGLNNGGNGKILCKQADQRTDSGVPMAGQDEFSEGLS
jgi:hypothetical protein